MRISVTDTLGDLERDLRRVPVKVAREMAQSVKSNAKAGNRLAAKNATATAGRHGKHYPDAFTAEAITPLMWEYGPDSAKPQGGMSFEEGSRNQPPHHDLLKSMDVYGWQLRLDARDAIRGAFW